MKNANEAVIIIDDDPSTRQAITTLIDTVGLNSQTYASGHPFLQSPPLDVPSCLVLDVRLPGLSGGSVVVCGIISQTADTVGEHTWP
jgi:FixJ family two-component response regulator